MLLSALIFHKKHKKKLAIVLILLCFFLLPVHQVFAGDVEVTDEESLRRAISLGAGSIIINDVIQLQDVIEINNSITITGSGRIEVSDHHRHFQINSSGSLTLEGEVTLTRSQEYTGYGGGIVVAGTLTMNGGKIRDNTGNWGGGVSIGGEGSSFRMNGGVISDNTGNWGGGVFLGRGASMTLFNGKIRNNRADVNGGGIAFDGSFSNPPSLRMYGGLITENSAGIMGGGLALCSTDRNVSRAWLLGGEISHNTATGHGGVYSSTFSQLTIGNNGRVRNNYPANSYEENISILSRITTPNIFRLAVVLVIAGVGTFFTIKKREVGSIE